MLGVDDYLTKPFDDDDLLAIVQVKIIRLKKVKNANKKIIATRFETVVTLEIFFAK
ncbi:MAG: response regulator transcription factor [Promethearchaeota archaeon]|nr:MAG: response regulator transcription factor [Candidatus Lokiarchaeota archaeon]